MAVYICQRYSLNFPTFSLPHLPRPHFYSLCLCHYFWRAVLYFKRSGQEEMILTYSATTAKSHQSCLTLCYPTDGSPPGSPGKNTGVGCHFHLQCMKVKVKSLSHIRLFATPWTVAYHAPPSMGFPRQEYWSGVPLPSPTNLF